MAAGSRPPFQMVILWYNHGMVSQEYPPAPPQEEERDDGKKRERELLIMRGEAIDNADASEALRELSYIEFLRAADRAEQAALAEQEFNDPATETAIRYDLIFPRATLEVGETPDEIEFLWWNALSDMQTEKPQNETDSRRKESARARAKRNMLKMAAVIGNERAHELFARYRKRLQQIYGAYDDLERKKT